MRRAEYLISPTLTLLGPAGIGVSVDSQKNQHRDYDNDVHKVEPDLLPHSDMSWGSLEDRYVPHEIPSDYSSSTSSTSSTSSSDSSSVFGHMSVIIDDDRGQCVDESEWGRHALDIDFWDDAEAPVVQFRPLHELLFDDLEFCGFFTDRLIGVGSSFLTKSPENGLYVLNKCVMRNMSLTNITLLHYHRYLRYIDLAYNYISNLSPLGGVPYLMYLNVAHNRMKHIINFKPPWYLTSVNLSYNYISEMKDFSSFWSIVRLDLSHNAIEVISGLQNLKYLKYLNLSYNLIECIENLDKLNIQELNLEGNCISSFRSAVPGYGINTLAYLNTIILGYNKLSSLEFFRNAYTLRIIDLKFNKINDLLEVSNFKGLIHEIDLRGNGCTKWPNYKGVLLFSIPSIKSIDGSQVTTAEKVSAATLFASPVNIMAARTVTKLTLFEQLNVPKIDLHVKPYDEVSPPLLILTGPSAVKKISLALHVVQSLPKRVKYCQWYTTKQIENSDAEQQSYIFVTREVFNDMTRNGDFLAIQELLGNSYGFHHEQIISLITEKKIGITQMDLHAAMQMNKRYPNTKPILVLTKSEEVHRSWIREKFDVYTWIKDSVENLLAVKIGKHTEEDSIESATSILHFIEEILDDVVESIRLPSYSVFVRPQGTGATTTDIILQSKTLLPKAVVTKSELEMEQKKRITFQDDQLQTGREIVTVTQDQKNKTRGLRVILDEDSNIIIEDAKSRRKRQQARILHRRDNLEGKTVHSYVTEELGESISSEDDLTDSHLFTPFTDARRPEFLKDMYTDLVIRTRNMYQEHHMTTPGFFSLVLLTDEYTTAFNALIDFIHESYTNYLSQKPRFLMEVDHFTKVAIPAVINTIADRIEESLSTSALQRKALLRRHGMTSWKNLMPSQLTQNIDRSSEQIFT